ncbi:MAG: hypothetical protein N2449_02015 [Bacteroidales bacterium]|nr:hypothetical protein [Bacteroidales bacterium]
MKYILLLFITFGSIFIYSQEKFSVEPYFNPKLTVQERDSLNQRIKQYSTIIASDSLNVMAYIERGCTYIKLGMHHKAYNDFSKVIIIDSTHAIAYYNRAISRSKFSYNYDACSDLYKAYLLGLNEAHTLYLQHCSYYRQQIENKK